MFKTYIFILYILYSLLPLTGSTQPGIIKGYIIDADSKTPIPGASINLPGNKGDNADLFGMFLIPEVNAGRYEMIISHIGYRTEIIPVEVKADLLSTLHINLQKATLHLSEVTINGKRKNTLNTISAIDIRLRPVNNSQDVLRIVPGLFIAQHAGGGKAEQIFLRGYDSDHGTDISISVDGIPVNMVSHAHGQGYADLHFLIPETVERVAFEKGPYNTAKGNLATAAYVEFNTKDLLDQHTIKTEIGRFNSKRAVGLFKVFNKQSEKIRQHFYIASEYVATDGYFESPQDFHRLNIMGKYKAWFGKQADLTILVSGFDSKWKASGQVPDRAVRTGIITRFGAIDDTEGGNTSRSNLSLKYNKQRRNQWQSMNQLYFSRYHFNLYSNFSFFLEDSVNGDMIRQRESRNIFGYHTTESRSYFIGNKKAITEFGVGFRLDMIKDIELSKAVKRQLMDHVQLGDVKERNSFIYVNQEIEIGNAWNVNAGFRYDQFKFQYRDKLRGAGSFAARSTGILSPKLNFSFTLNQKFKFYLNNGFGFHSNDTRLILNRAVKDILPRVFGTDLGMIFKPGKDLILKAALWHLYSQQEFVYVGDAGIVEPKGRTRRFGTDVSARAQFNNWLFGDIDINISRARAIDEGRENSYVPLAPSLTSIGGLTARMEKAFSGSIRYRFIDGRPANENNSVRAEGYILFDLVVACNIKRFELTLALENMLDREWREAQFETESRLKHEPLPVAGIHYTPGTPRSIKLGIGFKF